MEVSCGLLIARTNRRFPPLPVAVNGRCGGLTMASIVGVQCFLARKALGWSLRDLAEAADVASDTVRRFECGGTVKRSTLEAIQRSLEEAGVIFIGANDGGPGARLRK